MLFNDTMQQSVIAAIKNHWPNVVGIGLFGSVARGTTHENSDIDLLIVLQANTQLTRRLYTYWDECVEPTLPSNPWSPHFVIEPTDSSSLGSIWLEFASEGKILSDDSSKLATITEHIRELITKGYYQKMKAPGAPPYWRSINQKSETSVRRNGQS